MASKEVMSEEKMLSQNAALISIQTSASVAILKKYGLWVDGSVRPNHSTSANNTARMNPA